MDKAGEENYRLILAPISPHPLLTLVPALRSLLLVPSQSPLLLSLTSDLHLDYYFGFFMFFYYEMRNY